MRGGFADERTPHIEVLKPVVKLFVETRAKRVKPVNGVEQATGIGFFAWGNASTS
jgi:hypothetical protein